MPSEQEQSAIVRREGMYLRKRGFFEDDHTDHDMAKARPPYPPEFKRQIIALHREQLNGLPKMSLMARRLALRPGSETPIASSKHVLRALARRWRDLNAEIQEHAEILEVLVRQVAPQVTAAFASVPIPASSGTTTQHRLTRGTPPGELRPLANGDRPDATSRTDPGLRRPTHA